MNAWLLILIMIIIGSLIGGVTNSLAIKMLFRPYEAKYIGNFKIPFTPGLIPKRQKELAQQMGRMVVQHLLTAEGLKKKILNKAFQEHLNKWVEKELETWLQKEQTIRILATTLELDVKEDQLTDKISSWVEDRYEAFMIHNRHCLIKDVIGNDLVKKGDLAVSELSKYVLTKFEQYLSSEEGREKIGKIIDGYLGNQGFFGNMISSFLGNDGLADKIQPAISNYLKTRDAEEWLENWLQTEWEKIIDQPVEYFEQKIDSKQLAEKLGEIVGEFVPLSEWLDKPVASWIQPFRGHVVSHIVPAAVGKTIEYFSDRIDVIMERLHLSEIVQEEVEGFSVGRLEEMVLGISKREFKMITYLGALLGGVIGLLQGVFVTFLL